MSDNALIKAEHLTHIYSQGTPFEHIALNDVCFEIEKCDFIGVIGHTGSGKSTLMQHLNGLMKPTSGKLYFNGRDVWEKGYSLKDLRFRVGVVFQYPEYQLFEETVRKDVAFGPKNMGLSEDETEKRVIDAIRFVGLDESVLEKSPFDLSGGQKRRVAIAGIMAMRPQVLVLDEPTAGLDPYGRDQILDEIENYHKDTGATVLFVSHRMEDIAKTCSRIMVMSDSKLAMFDTVQNVFARADELVAMGLDIPQITRVFLDLKKSGYDIDGSVFTPERAVEEIFGYLNKKGKLND